MVCVRGKNFACMLSYISFLKFDMQHDRVLKKATFNRVKGEGQCQSSPKMVHDTLPAQDASTYQI